MRSIREPVAGRGTLGPRSSRTFPSLLFSYYSRSKSHDANGQIRSGRTTRALPSSSRRGGSPSPDPGCGRSLRNLSKKQLAAVSRIGHATAPGQASFAGQTVRKAHSEQGGEFPTKQAHLFFGEFSPLFFMPGSLLVPTGQTGGSKSGLRSALHRRDGSRGRSPLAKSSRASSSRTFSFVSSFTLCELALRTQTV